MRDLLGKHGGQLYRFACGEDDRPVEPVRERKSVGKEVTLERDIRDRGEMERILEMLSLQVEHRLLELGLAGRTLTLKVRWSSFDSRDQSRQPRTGLPVGTRNAARPPCAAFRAG